MLANYLIEQVATDIVSILFPIQVVHLLRGALVYQFDPLRLQCLQRLEDIREIDVKVLRLTSANDVSQVLPDLEVDV